LQELCVLEVTSCWEEVLLNSRQQGSEIDEEIDDYFEEPLEST
jgi:hypothetical protein